MRLDFAVTGLARSRTAWWAAFLSAGNVSCRHEYSRYVFSPSDYLKAIRPGFVSGVSDTCFWLLGTEARKYAKRILVIHRDPSDVRDSVRMAFGSDIDFSSLSSRLDHVDGLHVGFDEMDDRRVIASCYEYLTGAKPDAERLDLFCSMNIQVSDGLEQINSVTPSHWASVEVSKCL